MPDHTPQDDDSYGDARYSGQRPVIPAPKASAVLPRPKGPLPFLHTAIDVYPKCSCDETCSQCAEEMANELGSVLAVLNTAQYGQNPYQLPFEPGGVADLVAQAVWGPRP